MAIVGVILAGGQSRRMGQDKAMLELSGKTLLAWAIERVGQAVPGEVLVVGGPARPVPTREVRHIPDRYPGAGPLGGIATALEATGGAGVLVVACDMPFLNVPLLRRIIGYADEADVVVPRLEGFTHQMHAYYGPACLPIFERQLEHGDYKIDRAFNEPLRVRYVDAQEVERFDPEHRSVRNLNTPEDWEAAKRLV